VLERGWWVGWVVDGWGRGCSWAGGEPVVGLVLRLFLFSLDYNKRGGESVI